MYIIFIWFFIHLPNITNLGFVLFWVMAELRFFPTGEMTDWQANGRKIKITCLMVHMVLYPLTKNYLPSFCPFWVMSRSVQFSFNFTISFATIIKKLACIISIVMFLYPHASTKNHQPGFCSFLGMAGAWLLQTDGRARGKHIRPTGFTVGDLIYMYGTDLH